MMDDPSQTSGWNGADWLGRAVRHNPEGLLLLGAGLALLMRSAPPRKSAVEATFNAGMDAGAQVASEARDGAAAGREAMAAGRDAMSAGVQQAKEVAGSYIDTASQYVRGAQESIAQGSSQLKQQAGRVWNQGGDLLQNQPLAIAALGIGVGLALAAFVPVTAVEEQVVGATRDRVAETARQASDRVARATGAAGSELVNAIEKRGFTQSGVKEIVNEVATSFTGALSDHDRPQSQDEQSGAAQAQSPQHDGAMGS